LINDYSYRSHLFEFDIPKLTLFLSD